METTTTETLETNPYLIAVSKKYRNLKKKYDKIKSYEAKAAAGNALNEEQQALILSKPSIEKSLQDIESVKIQIQEIANELAISNPKPALTSTETNTNPSPEATIATTQVDDVEVSEVGIQSDPTPAPPVVVAPAATSVELRNVAVEKIFKALHVCSRYKEVTGKDLPENVDFFGKSLLGLTSIRGFGFTLAETLRSVQIFLDEELSKDHEVVRGISYYAMSIIIDDLASQMDGPKSTVVTTSSVAAEVPPVIQQTESAPSILPDADVENTKPNINFYLAPDEEQDTVVKPSIPVSESISNPVPETVEEKEGEKKQRRFRERRPKPSSFGQGAAHSETENGQTDASQPNDQKKRNRHRPKPNVDAANPPPGSSSSAVPDVIVSAPSSELVPPTSLAPSTNVWAARAQAAAASASANAQSSASTTNPKPRRPYPRPQQQSTDSAAEETKPEHHRAHRPFQHHGGRGKPQDGHHDSNPNPNPRPRRPHGEGRPVRAPLSTAQVV